MQNTVICRDGTCNEIEADIGRIVLAAWDRGLGSVINGQGITRSDIVREVATIPDNQVIMTCVAMGYRTTRFLRTASGPSASRTAILCAMLSDGGLRNGGANIHQRRRKAQRDQERIGRIENFGK
jgi:Nitroreductase family